MRHLGHASNKAKMDALANGMNEIPIWERVVEEANTEFTVRAARILKLL
jgi:hypothetical protein